jgi:hypothetical protein
LDDLEGAFDEDRVGLAPEGATLEPWEHDPAHYRDCHRRLRLANVRWILSFTDLPGDLVTQRGQAAFPEIREPLRLYELLDPLPRAFRVPRYEVIRDRSAQRARTEEPGFDPRAEVLLEEDPGLPAADPIGDEGRVELRRVDPHTVEIHTSGSPGFVVVLEGHHRDWRAERDGTPVPLYRADGRYWALATPGGDHVFRVRFQPAWRTPALLASGAGALAALALVKRGRTS